jgi:hypothetical protein
MTSEPNSRIKREITFPCQRQVGISLGFTYSLDFPTKNAYQPQRTPQTHPHEEPSNAFVTKIAFN